MQLEKIKKWLPQLTAIAFILFIIFYPSQKNQPAPANILQAIAVNNQSEGQLSDEVNNTDPDCSCEETFNRPIEIVWTGRVIANMMGGIAYGIERTPRDEKYPSFFAWLPDETDRSQQWLEGNVRVRGRWIGITCAYKNTVFGQCVPDVEIEKIE